MVVLQHISDGDHGLAIAEIRAVAVGPDRCCSSRHRMRSS